MFICFTSYNLRGEAPFASRLWAEEKREKPSVSEQICSEHGAADSLIVGARRRRDGDKLNHDAYFCITFSIPMRCYCARSLDANHSLHLSDISAVDVLIE
jgi:hypothetical protein